MITNAPILYAEDDEHDVFFLQHAFQAAGITNPLQVARDGQEAIDYLSGAGDFADRSRYPLPCLILLDLKMPGVSGMEVLAWLRQVSNSPPLPVIVLSSSAQPRDIDRAFALGANAFVVKPASIDERIRLARSIQGFWLDFNQPQPACLTA
jgi:CheY-like chemotaxis protein